MIPQTTPEAPPKATQSARTFRMECAITVNVRAPAARIWTLLTDADDMPRWNSTITRIHGPIAQGTRLELAVPIALKRALPDFGPPFETYAADLKREAERGG